MENFTGSLQNTTQHLDHFAKLGILILHSIITPPAAGGFSDFVPALSILPISRLLETASVFIFPI